MMDLYSIGEMVIDFIPGSESASYIRNAGGAPANVAVACAKNGLEAGMCCCVGDDDFGVFLMETLTRYHVRPLRTELCKDAITTMAFVTLDDEGDRSFTFARKPGADMFLQEEDVRYEDIGAAAIAKIQGQIRFLWVFSAAFGIRVPSRFLDTPIMPQNPPPRNTKSCITAIFPGFFALNSLRSRCKC